MHTAGSLISINNNTSHNNANASPNSFELASLQGLLQEIGLKSASCLLVFSYMEIFTCSSQLLHQRGAWPPLPAGCISLPQNSNLMRFSFDFSHPEGRGGGGELFGKKRERMVVCGVILNSGSDELFKTTTTDSRAH